MARLGINELTRDVEIHPAEVGAGKPRCRCFDLLSRFVRKEFGSGWEEQYKEFEDFWQNYFVATPPLRPGITSPWSAERPDRR
jgi:hypothetical protein